MVTQRRSTLWLYQLTSQPRWRVIDTEWLERERESLFPRDDSPDELYNPKWLALDTHTHSTLNILSRLYLYIHMHIYIHIYVTTIIKEDEVINFIWSWMEHKGSWKTERVVWKWCKYSIHLWNSKHKSVCRSSPGLFLFKVMSAL